jgi:hypothetical protein
MRYIYLCILLSLFFSTSSISQVSDSDRLFKMATDFVREKKYTEAVVIFEELAKNNEHDAQYNLAFLISDGKGITKNYSEALFWAFLSWLGKIEKAEELSEEITERIPEKVLKNVRERVLKSLLDRFKMKDIEVLMQLGDFHLMILEEQDFENAYLWYTVASALGVENSSEKRDKVERELEPDTIVKIQSASRERYEEFKKGETGGSKETMGKVEKEYES